MNLLKYSLSILALLALASCGGGKCDTSTYGGGAGTCQQSTTTPPPVTVANLTLNLSAATVNNSGSETVTATVIATNENNQRVSGATVVLRVDNGGEITVDGSATDTDGQLTGTVFIGDDHTNRTITVTAVANGGNLTRNKTLQVTGAKLTGTPIPATLKSGAAGQVRFTLRDSSGNGMDGIAITVAGPGGAETSGTTDASGDYLYDYTAPATTGDLTITARAGGAPPAPVTVVVQPSSGGGSIPPVDSAVSPIRSSSLSANPSVVAVSTDTIKQQAQLRALFLTNGNAPVKNIRVRFDLAGDANSIGGSISTGDFLVYTDASGIATSAYVSGTRASPTDGLTVRACWDYADFDAPLCPHSTTTTLTVIADPVSVSIGTNGVIATGTSGLTYVKRYVVQAVDSSGLAKPDVLITPSIDLLQYQKGFWFLSGDVWVQQVEAVCDNEDINRNNVNEVYPNGQAEDANHSLNLTTGRPALEPRKADVGISVEGSNTTDTSGQVVLRVEYPQNLGSWVEFNLTVSASGISATEGRANFVGILPVPGPVLRDKNNAPPFELSPYGTGTSPTTLVTAPDGRTGLLCTNPN